MGMSSTPTPPDPMATVNAQAGLNRQTATTQQQLNMVDQTTPDGSLNYNQTGTWADGTPKFNATTALNPVSQGIFDTNKVTEQNIANIGRDQSARIGGILGSPLKLGNEATEARLMELGMSRLTPQFARDEEAMRTRLVNSGIREGSAAWGSEMGRQTEGKNDAIIQLLLQGRGQANQEMLTERNQPINEITALMSGSQVGMPSFASTPQSNVAGVDYASLVNDNYKAQVTNQQALMGGMFGLGSAALGGASRAASAAAMSDRRLKTDISEVGKLANGLPIYVFRYKSGGPMQIGLMADDVEKIHSDAVVVGSDGFKRVYYAKAVEAA